MIASIIMPVIGIVVCLIGIALTVHQSRKPAPLQHFWPAGLTVVGMWVCVVGLAIGRPAGVWLAMTVVMGLIAATVTGYSAKEYRVHRASGGARSRAD